MASSREFIAGHSVFGVRLLLATLITDVLYYAVVWEMLRSGAAGRIALIGPTAVGKTAVGIAIARQVGAEIISADSMQVYRHMEIGTAKPTPEERSQAVFHLIDVVDPDQEWTLADFQRAGEAAWDDISGRQQVPLIVGGTGLYVRALTTRLDIPTVVPNEELREKWRSFAVEHGNEALRAEVARIDPQAAARIHVNDVKRLVRALEVYEELGVSLSELHARNRESAAELPTQIFGLNFIDRRALYTRIEKRVDQMIDEGFVDEVRSLLERGYSPDLKPMHSLGYRHIANFLAGEYSLPIAIDEIKKDTRHFARRQLIWFRGDSRIQWIDADKKDINTVASEIIDLVEENTHKGDTHVHE